uniref:Uncharacterized protein n=1 Tax=Micrurus spixii TaxID=129469 RepID=A0A2D4NPN2_9SAUR
MHRMLYKVVSTIIFTKLCPLPENQPSCSNFTLQSDLVQKRQAIQNLISVLACYRWITNSPQDIFRQIQSASLFLRGEIAVCSFRTLKAKSISQGSKREQKLALAL